MNRQGCGRRRSRLNYASSRDHLSICSGKNQCSQFPAWDLKR